VAFCTVEFVDRHQKASSVGIDSETIINRNSINKSPLHQEGGGPDSSIITIRGEFTP